MEKQKIIVLIPTCNRPFPYLWATVHSVCIQARQFNHDVEIVISDLSYAPHAEKNRAMISRLAGRFPMVPIHHYTQDSEEPIKLLMQHATVEERSAYENLIPHNGYWGANRNRLALLGVYHGGTTAVYLHLDDDTPLLELGNAPMPATIRKSKSDILSQFLRKLEKARASGRAGFTSWIVGVPAGEISTGHSPHKPPKLRKQLLAGIYEYGGSFGGGAGKIFPYHGMEMPYDPYEIGESASHGKRLGGLKYDNRRTDSSVYVLHIGAAGYAPLRRQAQYPDSKFELFEQGFARLIRKMAVLRTHPVQAMLPPKPAKPTLWGRIKKMVKRKPKK